jgi:3'(2'), 5'-bisphosphate nucleotidase
MVTPVSPGAKLDVSRESLERLVAIARDADSAILQHYHPDTVAEVKEDRTPITAADRAAHRLIVDALAAWDPSVPVISEEGAIPPFTERQAWTRFWLVDPLDGTKEFLKQNGEFTVNIALIEHGVPVLGVVSAPALGLTYSAGRGLGAWTQHAGSVPQRMLSRPPAPGAALTVVESRSHPSEALEAYLRTLPIGRRIQAGSSLKFCWVAEGKADLYPRMGPTMEWDVAAGDCVFRNSAEVGERVSSLTYNRPDLRNDSFIIGLE